MDYDALVIGSGFGGSVAALRLSEKGYRVAVLEQGRRITPADMDRAEDSLRQLLWLPALGWKGFFTQSFLKHVTVVGGVGVGGGSLVYAAVLLEPGDAFYNDPAMKALQVDWQAELKAHYRQASSMLGVATCPCRGLMDDYLEQAALRLGAGRRFSMTPLGIYFGEAGVTVDDPYFGGQGPQRTGCVKCGRCLSGCPYGAKNSLDANYLYLAEQLGAEILPEHKATLIRPLVGGGYQVECCNPFDPRQKYPALSSSIVIVAAGVLGTLRLLFRSREAGSLPDISPRLGWQVRTNSEAVVGILSQQEGIDLSGGPTISSHFYLGEHTHITQNRFPKGFTFMKWYNGPLVDGDRPGRRALRALAGMLRHPVQASTGWRANVWHKKATLLTVMQNQDNQLRLRTGRGLFTVGRRDLLSEAPDGKRAPTYIPEANQAARALAEANGGLPGNSLTESVLGMSTTAHILGGCTIGKDRESGVIDARHEVFGYPGLYVVDGSAIPANVGVNPSLTITAMAERAMSLVPGKRG